MIERLPRSPLHSVGLERLAHRHLLLIATGNAA